MRIIFKKQKVGRNLRYLYKKAGRLFVSAVRSVKKLNKFAHRMIRAKVKRARKFFSRQIRPFKVHGINFLHVLRPAGVRWRKEMLLLFTAFSVIVFFSSAVFAAWDGLPYDPGE